MGLSLSAVGLLSSPAGATPKSCVPAPGARLARCNLSGVDLAQADLAGADLANAILKGADLAGADLAGANLTSARLKGADLDGADLTKAVLFHASSGDITQPPASLPPYWEWLDGYLVGPGADLEYTNLTGIDLSGAHLKAAYFDYANLTRANLSYAHLQYAYLEHANLTDADLLGATVSKSNLGHITWRNTLCPDGTMSNADRNANCRWNWRA